MSKYVYIAMSVFLLSVAVNAQVSYSVTLKPVKCVYKKTEGQTDYYQCEDEINREYKRENLLKEPNPHKVLYGCDVKGHNTGRSFLRGASWSSIDFALWNSPRKCDELTKKFNKENKEKILRGIPRELARNIGRYLEFCQDQYEEKLTSSGLNRKDPITWSDIGMEPIHLDFGEETIFLDDNGTHLSLGVDACRDCFVCKEPQNGQGISIILNKDIEQSDCKRGLTITRNISDHDSWLPVKVTSPKRGDVCSESLKSLSLGGADKEKKIITGISEKEPVEDGIIGSKEHKHRFGPNVWYSVKHSGRGCIVIQNHTGNEDSLTYKNCAGEKRSIVLKKGQEGNAGDGWWNAVLTGNCDVTTFKFAKGGMFDLRDWDTPYCSDVDKLISSWYREKEMTGKFVLDESDPCKDLTNKAIYVQENCKEESEGGVWNYGFCSEIYKEMKEGEKRVCLSETDKLIFSWYREKKMTGKFVLDESDPCKDLTDKAIYVQENCKEESEGGIWDYGFCSLMYSDMEQELERACGKENNLVKYNRCKDLTNLVRYLHEQCSALPKGDREWENCIEDYNYNKKRREQECLSGAEKKTDARDGKKNKTGMSAQTESDPCKDLTDKVRDILAKCTALPKGSWERKNCIEDYNYNKKRREQECLSGAEKKTDARDGKKNKTGMSAQTESDPCKDLTDKARNLFEKCSALPEGNQSRERKDCMKEYRRVKKEEKRACH